MDAIRTEGLTRRFGGTAAVDGLTFSVERGEIFGLVGPDGAGKTTTMRLLAAILDPTGGDAWILGHSIRGDAAEVHRRIGYMSQRFGLYADLTVLENLHFHADLYGVPRRDRAARIDGLFAFSGLGPSAPPRGKPVRRDEAETGALMCPRAYSRGPPSGRAHQRRGTRLPARFLRILHRLLGEGVTIFVATAYLEEAELCRRSDFFTRGSFSRWGRRRRCAPSTGGRFWEIRGVDPRRASAVLRQAFPDAAVGLFGDRVHLGTRDLPFLATSVETALAAAAVPFDSVLPVPPSLEDVFNLGSRQRRGRGA